MWGQDELRAIAEQLLGRSAADQTEVVIRASDEQLTRFANNEIHQNVRERNLQVNVRVVLGKRIGYASGNDLRPELLDALLERAAASARLQPEHPDFPGLPGPAPLTPADGWRDATAECTPDQRAAGVGAIARLAEAGGLLAAGAFSTESGEVAVANSLGVWAYHPATAAQLTTVVLGEGRSGHAERCSKDVGDIDPQAVAEEAVGTAQRSADPALLDPGEYEVVLGEYAVAEALENLNFIGPSGLALLEGRSFLELGAQQVHPSINLWDDGHDPALLSLPFDFEGQPRQRIDIYRDGVATAVIYDSQTAARAGAANTGHARLAPNPYGPAALHLQLGPGSTPRADLVRGVRRGVLVSRFWYVNVVQPKQAVLTGMTRDGTFLIEDGEVRGPIKNLRFTQPMLDALSDVRAISAERMLVRGYFGSFLVPALHLGSFRFTGVTE